MEPNTMVDRIAGNIFARLRGSRIEHRAVSGKEPFGGDCEARQGLHSG